MVTVPRIFQAIFQAFVSLSRNVQSRTLVVKVHIWLRACQVGQKFKASYAFEHVEFQHLVEIYDFRQGRMDIRQSQACQPELF